MSSYCYTFGERTSVINSDKFDCCLDKCTTQMIDTIGSLLPAAHCCICISNALVHIGHVDVHGSKQCWRIRVQKSTVRSPHT